MQCWAGGVRTAWIVGVQGPWGQTPQDWGTGLWELGARKEPLGQALGGKTGGIRATGVQ